MPGQRFYPARNRRVTATRLSKTNWWK